LPIGSSTIGYFTNYAYDTRNRLLSAGGVTNGYDALNNRIGQVSGTNTTVYVVNPNAALPQVLMRVKNGITNYYIYGAGLLYQITEAATGTNTLTYHYDYRGSTVALSGDNGLVTDRMEYSLYGSTTYRVGTNDTPFLFNGRYGVQTDPNGLIYMRSRYYNPYLCRFINPDPSGFKGGLNFYAYAAGNPVSYLDPFGLNAQATGDSDNSGLYNSTPSQISGQPCMVCHGVSAQGFNGDVNSFYNVPGSSGQALTGYAALEQLAINATPIVLSPLTGLETAAAEGEANIVGQSFGKLGTVVENPGQTITGFTDHGFTQADVRGLTWDTMQGTVQQPSVVLHQSAGQYLYVSPNSAVVLNPAGQIMTTYPSSMFGSDIQALLKAASAGH